MDMYAVLESRIDDRAESVMKELEVFKEEMRADIKKAKEDAVLWALKSIQERLTVIEERLPPEE